MKCERKHSAWVFKINTLINVFPCNAYAYLFIHNVCGKKVQFDKLCENKLANISHSDNLFSKKVTLRVYTIDLWYFFGGEDFRHKFSGSLKYSISMF